jgi:hypothetical protein
LDKRVFFEANSIEVCIGIGFGNGTRIGHFLPRPLPPVFQHPNASAVAGFGGQRFLVPQHEAATKASRCAG